MSKVLQQNLVELGYGDYVGAIDGIIGDKTKRAIKMFQRDRGLKVDGIAGRQTNSAISKRKSIAGIVGTKNFNINEFRSPDNNSLPIGGMHNELLLTLELLRWKLGGHAVIINSGYRTPSFNKRIGGYKYSNHLKGRAADIRVVGVSASEVHKQAVQMFNGVGKYRNFTHVDTDSKKVHFIGGY